MKRFSRSAAAYTLMAGILSLGLPAFAASPKTSELPAPETPTKAAAPSPARPSLSGIVVETMDAGGYSYVCLEKNGKKTWVAVPAMPLKLGQKIAFTPGMEMKNFMSKSLNRTFESIFFTDGPVASAAAKEEGKAEMVDHKGSEAAITAPGEKISVKKAPGPNAYTIGEIYAKKTALKDKAVVIRGKVVKVSAGIMGKTWIHLQDGTGNPKKNTHDLVVTTEDSPVVGDIVVAKGSIRRDKDFGYGYKYDVIMEEATIQR